MPNYRITVFKSWGSRIEELRWSNVYEVVSDDESPNGPDIDALLNDILDAEQAIHLTPVQLLSAVISTWEPDGEAYDPTSFLSIPLARAGLRAIPEGIDPLDSNVCFHVQFRATLGRNGRKYYRGCLLETDVDISSDGRFQLETASSLNVGGAAWVNYLTNIDDRFQATSPSAYFALIHQPMARLNPDSEPVPFGPVQVRPVVAASPGGVVINRRNHRYFDHR